MARSYVDDILGGTGITPAERTKLAGIADGAGAPRVPVLFSTSETAIDAHHGLIRMFNGTSPGRVTVPDSLTEGLIEYVYDEDATGISTLTIDRSAPASGSTLKRTGKAIGGRVLRLGGRAFVRVETGARPRIDGDLEPVTLPAPNGGMSFSLVPGLLQEVSGTELISWGDQYTGATFVSSGAPTVGTLGQMITASTGGTDVQVIAADLVNFAGTSTLFGIAFKIGAVTQTGDNTWLNMGSFNDGNGFYGGISGPGTSYSINVMTNVTAFTNAISLDVFNRPVAVGMAIFHPAGTGTGYVTLFTDEGRVNRIAEKTTTGINFVVNWVTPPLSRNIGCIMGTDDVFNAEYYAARMIDNVTFASLDDARDQASAMLAHMRGYVG